jgi:hypothetical protein
VKVIELKSSFLLKARGFHVELIYKRRYKTTII